MDANKLSSISKADTDEKIGEFWDTHDFTDFDTDAPDVKFDMACAVPIEVELFSALEQQAKRRGVTVEALVNLWLQQKLTEQSAQPAV
jgi:CopG antitoxin of type II toxin-antitoxin system